MAGLRGPQTGWGEQGEGGTDRQLEDDDEEEELNPAGLERLLDAVDGIPRSSGTGRLAGVPQPQQAERDWPGGKEATLSRQQFQTLYRQVGTLTAALALARASGLISWPTDDAGRERFPPEHITQAWVRAVDQGQAHIPHRVRQAFLERYRNHMDFVLLDASTEAAITSKDLAIKIRNDELPADKSSQYQHASNAAGWIRKNINEMNQPQQTINLGRLNIYAGERPQKQLAPATKQKRLKKPKDTVDAEFTEIPVG